jgi:hypothetical protein
MHTVSYLYIIILILLLLEIHVVINKSIMFQEKLKVYFLSNIQMNFNNFT